MHDKGDNLLVTQLPTVRNQPTPEVRLVNVVLEDAMASLRKYGERRG